MDGLSRIVKGYRDRIRRAGGSLLVTAEGAVLATMQSLATGGVGTIASEQLAFFDQSSPARTVLQTGRGNLEIINASGGAFANVRVNGITAGAITASGTLTVSGTGTHSFSGPVKVARADGDTGLFRSDILHASNASGILSAWRQGNRRFRLYHENTDDIRFDVVGGTGDGQSVTEALRIVNANGYVSVATRLGVGTASPGVQCDVVGTVRAVSATGTAVVGRVTAASISAGLFEQTAANATAPVLVVKGGDTPGAGGTLASFQGSSGTALALVESDGMIYSRKGFKWLNTLSQTTVGLAGGASALPATPTGYLPVYTSDGTKYVIPYYAAA